MSGLIVDMYVKRDFWRRGACDVLFFFFSGLIEGWVAIICISIGAVPFFIFC